jgi:hypothetical protein
VCVCCAFTALGGRMMEAQNTSVKGIVDEYSPDGPPLILPGVKVIVRDSKKKEIVGKPHIVDNGSYTIPLDAGDYEIFACDPDLNYEPIIRPVYLKEGSTPTKDFHLRHDNATTVSKDDQGRPLDPKVEKVCLVHKGTGCKAERTKNGGAIDIPGPEVEFEVLVLGDKPCA